MARQREFHAATQRDALHGSDARLAHRLDLAEGELCIVGQHYCFVERMYFLEQLPDVGPRHEGGRAFAGENDGNDIVFARQMIDHDHQFIDRAFVERIDRRVRDRDGRHALARRDHIILHEEIAVALEQRLLL